MSKNKESKKSKNNKNEVKEDIAELAAEHKRESQALDDLELDTEVKVSGDTVYVSPLQRSTKDGKQEATRTPVTKYMMYMQRLLVANGYVQVKGRGMSGPGFALIVSKVFRQNMASLGIKTSWECVSKPTVDKEYFKNKKTKEMEPTLIIGLVVKIRRH